MFVVLDRFVGSLKAHNWLKTHEIYEHGHDSADIADNRFRSEKQTIRHYFHQQLERHSEYKHIVSDLIEIHLETDSNLTYHE